MINGQTHADFVLSVLSDKLPHYSREFTVIDSNGNVVGRLTMSDIKDEE